MAATLHLTTAVQNAIVDKVTELIDVGTPNGQIEVRGTPQPASANDAATGTLLATLNFSGSSFGAASSGTATAASVSPDTSADATGTAVWARVKDANGLTIFDGNCGTSATTFIFDSVAFVAGGTVSLTSVTITMPSGE